MGPRMWVGPHLRKRPRRRPCGQVLGYHRPRLRSSGPQDHSRLPRTELADGGNAVTNLPFDLFENFAHQALTLTRRKVVMIWLVRRLTPHIVG